MNKNLSKNISILATFIFFIILFYPPLAFQVILNDNLRIILFSFSLFFLTLTNFKYKSQNNILINNIILIISLIFLISSIISNKANTINTALGYSSILIFSTLLFRIKSKIISKIFFNKITTLYIKFFIIVSVFSISNFFLNLFTTSLNFSSSIFSIYAYDYNVSIFGFIIYKYILGIRISRSFFFFIEPVYLAFFYLVNIFIISKYIKNKYFKIFNIVAGFATSSFFFIFGYLILIFLKFKNIYKIIIGIFIFILLLIYKFEIIQFFDSSSLSDRQERLQIGYELIQNIGIKTILFGNGYLFEYDSNKGVGSAMITLLLEGGVIALISTLSLIYFYCRKEKYLLILVFFSLILFEPNKYPLFWLTIVLCNYYKSIFNNTKI